MRRLFCIAIYFTLISASLWAQRLVLPGDYPDPSVVKIGDTYWASATTSNWGPAYPLLKSKDLVNWKTVSVVFPKLPDWADYYFWAPEITYENGKVYLYYTAHKKGGNLCIAVASADKPEGPYTDHGPLMCEEVGSIDAFPMRDDKGKLHMIWKEDGNSVGKPTPIWIAEMNEERTKLLTEKKELFRNDAPWEMNLVEGVSMMKRGDYYYAFYAAAGCCGAACTYGTGIARAKNLMGPWEKYAKNPVITHSSDWTCPGHGSPIEKEGKYYFLYHAYDKQSNVFAGRQGLLQEFRFTSDGWIEFQKETHPSNKAPINTVTEGFRKKPSSQWQWSVFQQPEYKTKGGELYLNAQPSSSGAFIGHKVFSHNYTATAKMHLSKSSAAPGLAVIGDEKNMIAAVHEGNRLKLIQLKDGKEIVLADKPVAATKKLLIQARVQNGKDIQFYYGKDETSLISLNDKPVDGTYLPPWDRAIRVGLLSKGDTNRKAVFDSFEMKTN